MDYTLEFSKKYHEEELLEKDQVLLPVLKEVLSKRVWKSLVDLGCGSGYYARRFAGKGKEILGIDKNTNQLSIARKIEDEHPLGIKYQKSNLSNLRAIPSNHFDITFLNYVLIEIPNEEEIRNVCNEAYRILKSKGALIIGQVHPHHINKNEGTAQKRLLNKEDSYFSNGCPAVSKALLRNGRYLTFEQDYHYTLEFILTTLGASGFKLRTLRELALNEGFPTHMVIVEEK